MNHKKILILIAALFGCGLLSSVASSKISVIFYPEIFYALMFAALVIFCIGFFMRDDRMVAKNKRQSFVKVIDRDMFISKRANPQSGKTLFLKVSIIAILGLLKRKQFMIFEAVPYGAALLFIAF